LKKFYIEGIYPLDQNLASYGYLRATYDKDKPKMNISQEIQNYKIVAQAKIPITTTETLDMYLRVNRNGSEQYTMQYRDSYSELRIRADTEHGRPHIDIEWPGEKQKKEWLTNPPKSYEHAINLILTNAEQNNPRIGAMYWLIPPIMAYDDRIEMLEQTKFTNGIETPLTVIARKVSGRLMNEVSKRSGRPMTRQETLNLFDEECKAIAALEREKGAPLEIENVSYRRDISPFSFTIIHPPGSDFTFEEYPSGKDLRKEIVGMVFIL
jgi:hypothetical protein